MKAEMIAQDLRSVRERSPLVHNITNYVVMEATANALLAVGASPVMAHAEEEMEDMVALAGALVVNIGTLSAPWIRAMRRAMQAAAQRGVPVVFDPVGAGATPYRTETAQSLLAEYPASIIRGNASEIRALGGLAGRTKGVDSTHGSEEALTAAGELARRTGAVVSVSGAVDLITDGRHTLRIANGHPLMARVTGMGCSASAITGAFAAVQPSPLRAAAGAMAVMGIAGEMAAERARGPGTLTVEFLDVLAGLSAAECLARLRLEGDA